MAVRGNSDGLNDSRAKPRERRRRCLRINLQITTRGSQRSMHPAEQPADPERDPDRRVGLGLDDVAHGAFERPGRLAGGGAGGIGDVRCLSSRFSDCLFEALRLGAAGHVRMPCVVDEGFQIHRLRRGAWPPTAYPIRRPMPRAITVVVWGLSSMNSFRKSWLATAASLTASAPSAATSFVFP